MRETTPGKIALYPGEDGTLNLEVRLDEKDNTVWLSQQQIAKLFQAARTSIVEHVKHIYEEGELEEGATCRIFRQVRREGSRQVTREITFYNLELITLVGYRMRNKAATRFRQWATGISEERLRKSQILNQEQPPRTADIIAPYFSGLTLLREYDSGRVAGEAGTVPKWKLTLEEARMVISLIANNFPEDTLLGRERGAALEGVIGAVYQSFGGADLYPTLEEKAAHLLYLMVKDHPLTDGNKRAAAALFVVFLARNRMSTSERGSADVMPSNSALTATTLMVALSDPSEKDLMVALISRMLSEERQRSASSQRGGRQAQSA